MFTLEHGKRAVAIARSVIEHHVRGESIPPQKVPKIFESESGVFVTLNTYPKQTLRGCIGFPEPVKSLKSGLIDAAKSASTRDPRFPPVKSKELSHLVIEVSLLTPPQPLEIKKATEYLEKIKIGKHGLIVEKGPARGLLLPQVPVEWKWDVQTFLEHTCQKAGMSANCWLSPEIRFYTFEATVFTETSPGGDVVQKELLSKG